MTRVCILALPGTLLSLVSSPMDVFLAAGVLWERVQGLPQRPLFQVELVTVDGRPVPCQGGIDLPVHRAMAEVESPDLVLISPFLSGHRDQVRPVLAWLRERHAAGAWLASVCTGAFVLAATGLLDGRTATTHWGAAEAFRRRYPRVRLCPQRLITDEGTLFCAGGAHAGVDLALYLVGRIHGREVATRCARALVVDPGRTSQDPYAVFGTQRAHGDEAVIRAQARMEAEYSEALRVEELAAATGMSQRTFERRFKAATGDTPLRYLQRVRVEAAKRLLEVEAHSTFQEITLRVGYEDAASFRRLFTRQTGLAPGHYRARFGAAAP